ncbi:MAG: glycine-rich domain-containing protein [Halobacteriaceae archaeon]
MKEAFYMGEGGSALNIAGQVMDCSTLGNAIVRSSPNCGLNLPHMKMGRICIDDACMTADDVRSLTNLSDDIAEQNRLLERKFGSLQSRIDLLARNRDAAFRSLNQTIGNRFDAAAAARDALGEDIDDRFDTAAAARDALGDDIDDRFDTAAEERDMRFSELNDRMSNTQDMIRSMDGVDARGGQKVYETHGYRMHVFNASGYLHVMTGGKIDILLVGGGGGSGGDQGGAGGGGGVILKKGVNIKANTFQVRIGKGGNESSRFNAPAETGGNTTFLNFVAFGGGGGGNLEQGGRDGGSGGGGGGKWQSSTNAIGGSGVPGQGKEGGTGNGCSNRGAGGGGFSQRGGDQCGGSKGGDGFNANSFLYNDEVGENGWVGGGGAGGNSNAAGGKGGGGGYDTGREDGLPNTGGGARGGPRGSNESGFKGGSGLVVVRYPLGANRDVGALDGLGLTGDKKPVAAYALRRLFGNYAGPQVRILRTSDNQVANMYYDRRGNESLVKTEDGEIYKSLDAWSGGSALVTSWDDQSGNDLHAKQNNLSHAPALDVTIRMSNSKWFQTKSTNKLSFTADFTLVAVAKPFGTGSDSWGRDFPLLSKVAKSGTNKDNYLLAYIDNKYILGMERQSDGYDKQIKSSSVSMWSVLVVRRNGSNIEFFVDGKQHGIGTIPWVPYTGNEGLWIGRTDPAHGSGYFDGRLTTILLFDYSLKTNDIKKLSEIFSYT